MITDTLLLQADDTDETLDYSGHGDDNSLLTISPLLNGRQEDLELEAGGHTITTFPPLAHTGEDKPITGTEVAESKVSETEADDGNSEDTLLHTVAVSGIA